jgi:hypothetical protein
LEKRKARLENLLGKAGGFQPRLQDGTGGNRVQAPGCFSSISMAHLA